MKYYLTLFSAIFIFIYHSSAQTAGHLKLNYISFELGKSGLIYNLSFDHKFGPKDFGYRVTAGSNFAKYLEAKMVGGGVYHLIGSTKHFLELGLDIHYLVVDEVSEDQRGFSFVFPDHSAKILYPTLNLGYRKFGKYTLFRVGFSPGIIEKKLIPGGYLSLGLRI